MQEVTLKIPEKKYGFFMELIKQLGFEVQDKIAIPKEHKKIVLDRMKKSKQNPDRLLDWENVKDDFKFD